MFDSTDKVRACNSRASFLNVILLVFHIFQLLEVGLVKNTDRTSLVRPEAGR